MLGKPGKLIEEEEVKCKLCHRVAPWEIKVRPNWKLCTLCKHCEFVTLDLRGCFQIKFPYERRIEIINIFNPSLI
jgi:hypothetical protein